MNMAKFHGVVQEEAWTCDLCGRAVLELVGYAETTTDDDEHHEETQYYAAWRSVIWPERPARTLGNDVPAAVRSLYAEASRAEFADALRLAGAGYRAAVEEICKDQGATKYKLYDKITELSGRLSPEVINALHEARMVGNDSLHDGLEFSAEEIDDVAELIREITVTLYDHPAQRKRMADARQTRRDALTPP
ncbi:DUF4145 domain-containing protein (plasmid) [Streptomycetaceae bacterium NBC_01309]